MAELIRKSRVAKFVRVAPELLFHQTKEIKYNIFVIGDLIWKRSL